MVSEQEVEFSRRGPGIFFIVLASCLSYNVRDLGKQVFIKETVVRIEMSD